MERIEQFLKSAKSVSIGYFELNISDPSELDQHQEGYSRDSTGRSLVTGKKGDWRKEWIVIGSDDGGDPIFVDLISKELAVLSAAHGEGDWKPSRIADSLHNFSQLLDKLNKLSHDREDPASLEENPISAAQAKDFLDFVRKNNPGSDIDFWESMIELLLDQ